MLTVIDTSKFFTVLANTLINSIPEEAFLAMFCLTLLKEFDFLKSKVEGQNRFKRVDIVDISVPVLLTAAISNLSRYSGAQVSAVFLISLCTMFISILIRFKRYSDFTAALKTLGCTILSFLLLLTIENSYMPLVLYATNRSIHDFNNSVFLNFLLSLPERLIEFALLSYLLLKKTRSVRVSVIKQILRSKILILLTLSLISVNLFAFLLMGKSFIFDRMLEGLSLLTQTAEIIVLLLLPVVNFAALICTIWYISNRDSHKKEDIKRQFKDAIDDTRLLIEHGRYEKIPLLLSYMEQDIEKIP